MISRPRPAIEGRPSARFAGKAVKSKAPKDARLVPQNLSNPRAAAAAKMMSK